MKKESINEREEKYSILLFGIIVSFLGWLMETALFYFAYGGFYDRGFISLPLCPIYGITLILIYCLLGTPQSGGCFLRHAACNGIRTIVYFILASIIPAIIELLTGLIMERLTGNILWDYRSYPMNLGKYVCLEISALWGMLIFLVMLFFDKIIKALSRIDSNVKGRLSAVLVTAIATDFLVNFLLYLL